jgi:hypothetical protein
LKPFKKGFLTLYYFYRNIIEIRDFCCWLLGKHGCWLMVVGCWENMVVGCWLLGKHGCWLFVEITILFDRLRVTG